MPKKVLSMLLVVCMLISMIPVVGTALAADSEKTINYEANDQTSLLHALAQIKESSDDISKHKVHITSGFSITQTIVFPQGKDIILEGQNHPAVEITADKVLVASGGSMFEIPAYGTLSQYRVEIHRLLLNANRAALQLNRSNGLTASGSDTNEDFIPAGGGRQTISVSAKIPYQGVDAVNTNIAQIIFVLGWNNEEIPLTGLKVVPEMPYMNVGDTQTLTITKIPEDTTDSNPIRVEYAGHLDGNQMNVSESGEITALGAGTTDVWITCGDYTMEQL